MVDKILDFIHSIRSGRLIFVALITVFVVAGSIALYNIITTQRGYSAAQDEYSELRQYSPFVNQHAYTPSENDDTDESDENEPRIDSVSKPDLSDINPDYVGWIWVEGTSIDYPVVQGSDNVKYLNTTFLGERNRSAAIFMDSRSPDGFSGFSILHGHNMRDGTMFAGLVRFIGHDFRDNDYYEIVIFTPEGERLIYRIFDARITGAYDMIYSLLDIKQDSDEGKLAFRSAVEDYFAGRDFPPDADILVLSTCSDGNRNDRLLIFAIR